MMTKIHGLLNIIRSKLDENEVRIRFQFLVVYILLGFVSLVMTLINLFTGYKLLMWQTLFFSICSLINIGLYYYGNGFKCFKSYK